MIAGRLCLTLVYTALAPCAAEVIMGVGTGSESELLNNVLMWSSPILTDSVCVAAVHLFILHPEPGESGLTPEEQSLLDRICEAYYLPAWCSIADYQKLLGGSFTMIRRRCARGMGGGS
jgi:hypothetical protein